MLRKVWFIVLLAIGLSACDTSTQSEPKTPVTPIPNDQPISKPVRLPTLTIPPYTLEGDDTEPLPGLGEPAEEDLSDLRLHYYVTSNVAYIDITVEYGELRYTFFPDLQGKCLKWRKAEPCWRKNDLETIGKVLTQEDLDNLTSIIIENKVLELDKDEYGAGKKRRKDSQSYTINLDKTERNISYYPAPLAEKKPEGLARIETALLQYARDLEAETYYPAPGLIPNQPGAE
ncbi:hypothetical protein [Thiofilum flexile]|uniref:hypothetical protein n=1 Tax=Thiofilum flexile TaxID=125627 RepID=UPI0003692BCD|nr:hypothetical protein [Thiofilum flexile]